jgi:AcrR family transcriptional regulator
MGSTATPSSRRERRIARRRRRILSAAAQVFADKGYASTTTKELADAADVAEGTLYNYFESKREILLAIAAEMMESPLENVLQELEGQDDRTLMISLVERALDLAEEQLPFGRAVYAEAWVDQTILQEFVVARFSPVIQQLQAYIANRVAAGVFRDFDPALGARLTMGIFFSLVIPAYVGVGSFPPAEERRALAETVIDLLLDGVRAR